MHQQEVHLPQLEKVLGLRFVGQGSHYIVALSSNATEDVLHTYGR
jgi:hypothetical protein